MVQIKRLSFKYLAQLFLLSGDRYGWIGVVSLAGAARTGSWAAGSPRPAGSGWPAAAGLAWRQFRRRRRSSGTGRPRESGRLRRSRSSPECRRRTERCRRCFRKQVWLASAVVVLAAAGIPALAAAAVVVEAVAWVRCHYLAVAVVAAAEPFLRIAADQPQLSRLPDFLLALGTRAVVCVAAGQLVLVAAEVAVLAPDFRSVLATLATVVAVVLELMKSLFHRKAGVPLNPPAKASGSFPAA